MRLPLAAFPLVVLPILTLSSAGCGKKAPKGRAFDCERLQKRAQQCEPAVLEQARKRFEAARLAGDRDARGAREAYLDFKRKFQRKIRHKALLKECRRVRGLTRRAERRRASGLRYCYSRPTCQAFARCLLSR